MKIDSFGKSNIYKTFLCVCSTNLFNNIRIEDMTIFGVFKTSNNLILNLLGI